MMINRLSVFLNMENPIKCHNITIKSQSVSALNHIKPQTMSPLYNSHYITLNQSLGGFLYPHLGLHRVFQKRPVKDLKSEQQNQVLLKLVDGIVVVAVVLRIVDLTMVNQKK